MQVVFHLGAHCTDEDRLLKSLLKNRDLLAGHGTIVPGPSRYRKLIRQTVKSLRGAAATQNEQDTLLKQIADGDGIKRLILSSEDFITFASWVFDNQALYGNTMSVTPALANLFPSATVEFQIGLRNPATFIPAVYARTKDMKFDDFMRGVSPYDANWSTMIHTIRAANPDAKLTVWCNEDTPLIWSTLMHETAGIDAAIPMEGETDLLAEIMSPDGMQRLHAYLETHPPKSDLQMRRIVTVFLDKFALAEKLEEDLDVPGWTQGLVDNLTDQYEEDLYEIERIPGVTFIGA